MKRKFVLDLSLNNASNGMVSLTTRANNSRRFDFALRGSNHSNNLRKKYNIIQKTTRKINLKPIRLRQQTMHKDLIVGQAENLRPHRNSSQVIMQQQQPSVSPRNRGNELRRSLKSFQLDVNRSVQLISNGQRYQNCLTDQEKVEVTEYDKIYYAGQKAEKQTEHMDQKGYYIIVQGDHIAFRYEIIKLLGKGSFGQVIQCFDHKNNEVVALKILRNKKRFHKQGAIEVSCLYQLRKNDTEDKQGVVHMKTYFIFRHHLCISFELLSMNLYEITKANDFQGFQMDVLRNFAAQLLKSLNYIRSLGIIHCDLKPENILLKQLDKTHLKIIDFGSSCFQNKQMFSYIQSRFYRAPEIILGQYYSFPIDMWSLGCNLMEFYIGYPLFPGENEIEQLSRIMEVIGTPPLKMIESSPKRNLFFDKKFKPLPVQTSRGRPLVANSKSLNRIVLEQDAVFADFIGRILVWEPEQRITPSQGLSHPWITGLKLKHYRSISC